MSLPSDFWHWPAQSRINWLQHRRTYLRNFPGGSELVDVTRWLADEWDKQVPLPEIEDEGVSAETRAANIRRDEFWTDRLDMWIRKANAAELRLTQLSMAVANLLTEWDHDGVEWPVFEGGIDALRTAYKQWGKQD